MKNLLLSVFFVLAVSGTALTQYQPGSGQEGYSAQAQLGISTSLAYRICQAAQPALYPYTGLTASQLYNGYEDGLVTITYLGTDPADPHKSLYRVSAEGGETVIGIIESI